MPGLSDFRYYFTIASENDVEAFRLADVADVHISMRNANRLGIRPTDLKDTFDGVMVTAGTRDTNATLGYIGFLTDKCWAVDYAVSPSLGSSGETAFAYRLIESAGWMGRLMAPYMPDYGKEALYEFDKLSDPLYIEPFGWTNSRSETSGIKISRDFLANCVQSRVHCGSETDILRAGRLGSRLYSADGRPHALARYRQDGNRLWKPSGGQSGSGEGGGTEGLVGTVIAIERFRRDCLRRGYEIKRRMMVVE